MRKIRNFKTSHIDFLFIFLPSFENCKTKLPIKNIGTLSVQELFFQLIGWLGVELGVRPAGMVYFMG